MINPNKFENKDVKELEGILNETYNKYMSNKEIDELMDNSIAGVYLFKRLGELLYDDIEIKLNMDYTKFDKNLNPLKKKIIDFINPRATIFYESYKLRPNSLIKEIDYRLNNILKNDNPKDKVILTGQNLALGYKGCSLYQKKDLRAFLNYYKQPLIQPYFLFNDLYPKGFLKYILNIEEWWPLKDKIGFGYKNHKSKEEVQYEIDKNREYVKKEAEFQKNFREIINLLKNIR